MNLTCNATLEELRILPTSEIPIAGSLTFHQLALIIAGGSTAVAILMSLYLIFRHATHYTKPREQKHIIRILFMVPIYSTASWLALRYYWHAIYFQVLSDCYEAFAISSFFALMCHYVGPDLHEQKEFFRNLRPITPWVWPVNWFAKCCGGERGPWRTPQSGLTWFNIIWIGIYHYCFIRVAMTITAVVTQYFGKYCESSNSPVFAHIWVLVVESIAVFIAMYCVIQFYIQLKVPLAVHRPFLKVLAIKLVIFLSFWQSFAISIGTSTLDIVHANEVLAYPDIKVGIPALLLCFEMALFAILHLWAFPWRPYADDAPTSYYPNPDLNSSLPSRENEHGPRQGGFLGIKALWDAVNIWDILKAFGRGIRWLFVGVKHRREDVSYRTTRKNSATENGLDMDDLQKTDTSYGGGPVGMHKAGAKSTDHLPIAHEFRRSQYGPNRPNQDPSQVQNSPYRNPVEERIGLIAHAQPNPSSPGLPPREPVPYHDQDEVDLSAPVPYYDGRRPSLSTVEEEPYGSSRQGSRQDYYGRTPTPSGGNPRNSTQARVGEALWGHRGPQGEPR